MLNIFCADCASHIFISSVPIECCPVCGAEFDIRDEESIPSFVGSVSVIATININLFTVTCRLQTAGGMMGRLSIASYEDSFRELAPNRNALGYAADRAHELWHILLKLQEWTPGIVIPGVTFSLPSNE